MTAGLRVWDEPSSGAALAEGRSRVQGHPRVQEDTAELKTQLNEAETCARDDMKCVTT